MDKFSPKHFAFLILGTAVVSMKTYPTTFLRDGQRDTWIAIIVSSAMILLFFLYIVGIWKRNSGYDLIGIYKTALGNVLGTVLIGLFAMALLLTLVECSAVEADAVRQNILLRTPAWYLMLFFIGPSLYIVRRNLAAVLSVAFVALVLISISGMSLALLTAKYKKFEMLLPILDQGVTRGLAVSAVKTLGLYGCAAIALPYLGVIDNRKNTMTKATAWGLAFLIQMQLLSVAGLVMTFGPTLYTMNYPKLMQTQLISFMQFLEFGELYVLFQTIGGWLLKYMLTFYAILMLLRGFHVSKKLEVILTYAISVVVFAASYFIALDSFVLFRLLTLYEYICLVNFVVIPFIVFTVFSVRVKKKGG